MQILCTDENDGLIMAMQVQQQQGSLTNGSGAGKPSTDAQVLAANPGLITPSGTAGQIATPDPNLIAAGLPPYPLLPCTMPVTTVEEIRRTVQVRYLRFFQTHSKALNFVHNYLIYWGRIGQ